MDDVLTDHEDPEKRIADLERRLTESDAPGSRRFVVASAPPSTKQMMKYVYLLMFGAMASLGLIYMLLFLIGALLGADDVMKIGGFIAFMAFLLLVMPAFAMFQRRVNRAKTVVIDVGSGALTVSSRPGQTFSFGDARVGAWTLAGYGGTTKGTALHLGSGRRGFVLGGQDHRVAPGTRLDAPPVDSVDATMWATEFDELLALIGRPLGVEARGPLPGQPTRCPLTPNPARLYSSSIFGAFKNTATALRMNANPPKPGLAIEVGDEAISVIDLASNSTVTTAPATEVSATPAASARSARYMGTLTTAVLVVRIGNSEPLTIACPDYAGAPQTTWGGRTKLVYRFGWRGDVPSEQEPAFVVSDADWLLLVEKFALTERLEDRARTDAAAAPATAPLARPKRKLWIYGVIIAAVMCFAIPAIMLVAAGIWDSHQSRADQQKADQERPFALPFTGLRVPHGVAVDAAGNVYVTDAHTNSVLKLAAGSGTQTVLPFTGLDLCATVINTSLDGVAVDAGGNVYVADSCNGRVVKLSAGSGTQTVLPLRRLRTPYRVAVDAAGVVYVVNYSDGEILRLAPGSSTPTVLPKPGNGAGPDGTLAVDSAGNVYAGFSKSRRRASEDYLMRLAPGSQSWTALPPALDNNGAPLRTGEQDVAVDARGNVYVIASAGTPGVWKLSPGSDNWTPLQGAPPFVDPLGLAVDPAGNSVYVTDHTGERAQATVFDVWTVGSDDAQGFVLKLPVS